MVDFALRVKDLNVRVTVMYLPLHLGIQSTTKHNNNKLKTGSLSTTIFDYTNGLSLSFCSANETGCCLKIHHATSVAAHQKKTQSDREELTGRTADDCF